MIERNQRRWLRTYGYIALILGVTCSAGGTSARIGQDSNQAPEGRNSAREGAYRNESLTGFKPDAGDKNRELNKKQSEEIVENCFKGIAF